MANPLKAAYVILFTPQIITFGFYILFHALAVYFNLYFLIPRFLEKGQFLRYFGLLSLTLLSIALIIVAGYYLSAFIYGIDLENIYGKGTNCFFFFFAEAFPSTVASATFTLSIKLIYNWIQLNKKRASDEQQDLDYFFVKCGNKHEKVYFENILFIEGMQNYVTIYTTTSKHITLLSMKNLEHYLGNMGFIRVHKSYIVSICKIEGIERNELSIGSNKIPISRTYRSTVIGQLKNNTDIAKCRAKAIVSSSIPADS